MKFNFPNLKEACKCQFWRLSHLYLIKDEDGNIVPFVPRVEQWKYLKTRHNRNAILKSRKLGFSTLIQLMHLDECMWRKEKMHCAVIDKSLKDAKKKLEIAILAYNEGPNHPDPRIAAIWRERIRRNPRVNDATDSMLFKSGAKIEVGTSFRGGTPQRLHVSEFSAIAVEFVKAAKEIKSGAFNAVPINGCIDLETTHRGGRFGESYEIFEEAMELVGQAHLSALDWKFYFFPWMWHPTCVDPVPIKITPEHEKYFLSVEEYWRARGKKLKITDQRKYWYIRKEKGAKWSVGEEFPSTPDEAFIARIEGAIYKEMASIRSDGRLTALEHGQGAKFVSIDIGISDMMAAWLMEPVLNEKFFHAAYEEEDADAYRLAKVIRAWDDKYRTIQAVFIPHDGKKRAPGDGMKFENHLRKGLKLEGCEHIAVRRVRRIPNIWDGIAAVRRYILPKAYFDLSTDSKRADLTGIKRPSFFGCLEGYRKKPPTADGALKEEPDHNLCSHLADALRTMGEAMDSGMVSAVSGISKPTTDRELIEARASKPAMPDLGRDAPKKNAPGYRPEAFDRSGFGGAGF